MPVFYLLPYAWMYNINNKYMSNDHFANTFLWVSVVGLIGCLGRADYNVVVGLFGYLLWGETQFPQKHRVLWVLLWSILGDVLWLLLVSVLFANELQEQQEWSMNPHVRTLAQITSIVNLLSKMIMIFYAVLSVEGCADLFHPDSIKKKLLYL
jgi:heme/copper-type cytochrome/quinol oxidase subunit 2